MGGVPRPPAATTGMVTASKTRSSSGTSPSWPRTCPPASNPWATTRWQPVPAAARNTGRQGPHIGIGIGAYWAQSGPTGSAQSKGLEPPSNPARFIEWLLCGPEPAGALLRSQRNFTQGASPCLFARRHVLVLGGWALGPAQLIQTGRPDFEGPGDEHVTMSATMTVPSPRRDLGAVVLATVTASLPVFLVGTMAVEIRHSLHFSTAVLGLVVALYYLGAATSSVPASRLAEAVGGIRVMRTGALAVAVVSGLVAGVASSWAALTVLMVLAGMISGSMGPATNLFLVRRTDQSGQGLAFGIKQAAVPLAALLGGVAVPAVALSLGWRWAFGFASVLSMIAVVVIPAPRVALSERRLLLRGQTRAPVRSIPLTVLALGLGLGVAASSGAAAFLVSAAVTLGFAKGTAGLVAALAGACAVVSRVATGARADRRGGRQFPVIALMLAIGALGYLLLVASSATSSRPLFVVGSVLALGSGWGWNGLFNFAVARTHLHAPAAATGVTQVGGRLGGVAGPAVLGVVAAQGSYGVAWLVAAAAAAGGAGAMLVGHALLVRARSDLSASPPPDTEAPPPGFEVPPAP